jgi:hypothetical protein
MVCSSYPSLTTGGAQRCAPSGLCISPRHLRRNKSTKSLFGVSWKNYVRVRRGFWPQSETSRIIETVDGLGNKSKRQAVKHMETTDHNTILRVLERRAKRFRPEIRLVHNQEAMNSPIDEMGTLESLMDAYGKEVAARVVEQQELQNLNDEVLEKHGV